MSLNIDENELEISEENDCPLFEDANHNEIQQPKIKNVSKKQIADLEQQANYADRMDKHVYKKHGLHLMIGCGIAYFVIVLFDTIFKNCFAWEMSTLSSGLVELLKFTISTLIGFVFSENINKDKNEK